MRGVALDRRSFLKAAGAAFAASLTPRAGLALASSDAVFATAYRDGDGVFGVATLTERGEIVHRTRLPGRGHDVLVHPERRELVAFARRPGTFAAVIPLDDRNAPSTITTPNDRHFYGHGCFSGDLRLLYAPENDFDNARGVIGVYDATDGYRRVGEFASRGVGPHDIALLPDGRTLLVANGGIETHPGFPRAKLNIPMMAPNLAFVDAADGALIGRASLPSDLHKLSIRHLAMQADGTAWFACQNEGDIMRPEPLVGSISAEGQIDLLELAKADWAGLRGYVGSIACTPDGERVAFTSPKGGLALEVDASSGRIVSRSRLPEVCGAAERNGRFLLTTGTGIAGDELGPVAFDNHVVALTAG